MRWSNRYDEDRPNREHLEPNERNAARVIEGALAFAICFLIASFGARELFAASLSSLLMFAAFFSAAQAQISAEPINPGHLTHWDAAVALLLISVALSWLVDPEAIRAYLETRGHASPPSPN